MTDKIQIQINGQPHFLATPLSLQALLNQLKIDLPYIAVAVNGEIVPRSGIGEKMVRHGDCVEAIRAVAGG